MRIIIPVYVMLDGIDNLDPELLARIDGVSLEFRFMSKARPYIHAQCETAEEAAMLATAWLEATRRQHQVAKEPEARSANLFPAGPAATSGRPADAPERSKA